MANIDKARFLALEPADQAKALGTLKGDQLVMVAGWLAEHAHTQGLAAKAANERNAKPVRIAAGYKGGISVYGLARFPLTAYREQWQRIADEDVVAQVLAFAAENEDRVKRKDETHESFIDRRQEAFPSESFVEPKARD